MTKLHQLLALANSRKSRAQSELTKAHQKVTKSDLISGMTRVYQPREENGDQMPSEAKRVQYTAKSAIEAVQDSLVTMFDTVATIDVTNGSTVADVVVNGVTIVSAVPPTHLIFLEKQLTDLKTFVEKLPVLDPAQEWKYDSATDCFRSAQQQTLRTKKSYKNHVKSEATKEHPAQVEVFTEDVPVGTWTQTLFSGAIPSKERSDILSRVVSLQESVKVAREEANNVDVITMKTGKAILDFIFKENNAS